MVREDLVDGAVTFLQDPSVSNAPIEQKLSFLRSKNLTQEEIDASLSRVGQSLNTQPQQQQSYPPQQYRQPQQQYGGYQQQYPPWAQQPPEPPRRDWRDWFIMATLTGGVGYAMYWTAKRYIYPLIAPPTPPQLEQDKASIDASFDKAFALLDQLATDTQELKDSEKERKDRLDHALAEVESVVSRMKEAAENRETEAKRMAKEIDEIKEQIPQAIQKEKESMDGRLKELTVEMKSLKTLVGNRMGQAPPQQQQRQSPSFSSQAPNGINGATSQSQPPTPVAAPVQPADTNGVNGAVVEEQKPASALPDRPTGGTSPYGRMLGGKAQIPAWQLAAKKKAEDAKKESANGTSADASTESGTVADAEAGA